MEDNSRTLRDDNAPSHRAQNCCQIVHENATNTTDILPYSLNLATCKFFSEIQNCRSVELVDQRNS